MKAFTDLSFSAKIVGTCAGGNHLFMDISGSANGAPFTFRHTVEAGVLGAQSSYTVKEAVELILRSTLKTANVLTVQDAVAALTGKTFRA